MDWWQALVLGLVQGLTEFLPVSSSGHLAIFRVLTGVDAEANAFLGFTVLVHFATVCSTLVVFWSVIWKLLKGLFKFRYNDETDYVAKLVVSMIPVGVVGLLFKAGLISFRMDWLDLLAVQGTLKSLLQYHSSKASILQHSALFIVQLSHPYMTVGKTIGLTRQTFVDKVMSLLFNMLSRLVIAFLPRNTCHLISWLQSSSAVIVEPKKIKSVTVSPSSCHEVMGPDAMILVF